MRSFVALTFIGLAAAQKGRQTSEPVYSCPPPFELIGKQCTRQSSAPAQAFCASGILQGAQCLTPAQKSADCPPGSQATPAGGCAIVEAIPAEAFCPPGTHDIGGACQTYSVTGIIEVCARGQLVGGQCEIVEQVAAMAARQCPLGFTEQKGSCWRSLQMDCTDPNAAMQGKRMLQAKGALGGMHGGLGGGYGGFGAAPAIQAPRYVPAPAKLAVTQKQCEVKLEAPFAASSSCPNGMQMQGNSCIQKTFEPATVECSLGAPHLCFPTQTTAASHRCAPGFTLDGEICEKKVAIPKNAYCGPGLVEHGNGCAAVTPAQLRCGPGARLAGDMCISTQTTAPIVSVNVQCRGKNCFH